MSDTCIHGHDREGNTFVNAQGFKVCTECKRISNEKHRDKKRGRPGRERLAIGGMCHMKRHVLTAENYGEGNHGRFCKDCHQRYEDNRRSTRAEARARIIRDPSGKATLRHRYTDDQPSQYECELARFEARALLQAARLHEAMAPHYIRWAA